MAKIKNDYFKLIEQQVGCCVEAANLLEEILCDYSEEKIPAQKQHMHEIEHRGDTLHHEILTKLSTEFITPIDQEDILRLVQIIDDVTDAIDEVVLEFYMYHVSEVPEAAPTMANIVRRCVTALYLAVKELKNFKKPEKLRQELVKVNDIESEGDDFYIEAVHKLFGADISGKKLYGILAVYDCLENCYDLCENASEIIEQIVIKNT